MILEDKVFSLTINDDTWHVYAIAEHDHDLLEEGDHASTSFEKKELYIRKKTLQIIRHELIHVLVFYTYTETVSFTPLQTEELMCELISWNWDKINKLSNEIYKQLGEL